MVVAVMLVVVFGVSSPASAHKGYKGLLHLGHKNVIAKATTLVGKVATGSSLVVKNPSGGSALDLQVQNIPLTGSQGGSTPPPMKVNSDVKVDNLNSDQLDGKDSTQLKAVGRSARGSLCLADQGPETCAQTTVDLPASGRVLLNSTGSWAAHGNFPPEGVFQGNCVLNQDGTNITGTQMNVGLKQSASGAVPVHASYPATPANQATTYVTNVLSAGQHTFQVRCTQTKGDVDWVHVSISAVTLGDG